MVVQINLVSIYKESYITRITISHFIWFHSFVVPCLVLHSSQYSGQKFIRRSESLWFCSTCWSIYSLFWVLVAVFCFISVIVFWEVFTTIYIESYSVHSDCLSKARCRACFEYQWILYSHTLFLVSVISNSKISTMSNSVYRHFTFYTSSSTTFE